jgi:hypothetical protein
MTSASLKTTGKSDLNEFKIEVDRLRFFNADTDYWRTPKKTIPINWTILFIYLFRLISECRLMHGLRVPVGLTGFPRTPVMDGTRGRLKRWDRDFKVHYSNLLQA